jgi:hypothetical protein
MKGPVDLTGSSTSTVQSCKTQQARAGTAQSQRSHVRHAVRCSSVHARAAACFTCSFSTPLRSYFGTCMHCCQHYSKHTRHAPCMHAAAAAAAVVCYTCSSSTPLRSHLGSCVQCYHHYSKHTRHTPCTHTAAAAAVACFTCSSSTPLGS